LQNARRRRRDIIDTMISESSTPQPNSEPDDPMPDIIHPSQLSSNGTLSMLPSFQAHYYRCFQLSMQYSRVAHCLSTLASIHLSFILRATFTRILYRCVSILRCFALDGRTISSKLSKLSKVWYVLQKRKDLLAGDVRPS
jgi:hypothetical protein